MDLKTKWTLGYRCKNRKAFSREMWESFESEKPCFTEVYQEAEAKMKATYKIARFSRNSVYVDLGEESSSVEDYFTSAKVEDAEGEMDLYIKVFASDRETLKSMVDSFFARQGFLKYQVNGEFLTKAEREWGLARIDAKIEEETKRPENMPSGMKTSSETQSKASAQPQRVQQKEERPVLGHCPNCVHCVKEWPYLYCSEITEKRFGLFGEEVMKKVDSNGTCDHFIAKKTSSNSNYRRD